jgi:rhodanese-related sulfurtransferase
MKFFTPKLLGLALAVAVCLTPLIATAGEIPRISVAELEGLLGDADLVVLDVRSSFDWKRDDLKIKGAVREDPSAFDTWSTRYPKDKRLVLYCA